MDDLPPPELLTPHYRRVLLKLSGEGFGFQDKTAGISIDQTMNVARQAQRVLQMGVKLAIVVGGGNLIRGATFSANHEIVRKPTADYMGMLGTVMNGLALQDAIESLGCETRLMSALQMDSVAEPYIRRRCIRHLEKDRIVILAGGTGNPMVTTDTAAALRACEMEADILLKATKVEGVFDDDPHKNPHATFYKELTFEEVRQKNLKVMDMEAISLCEKGAVEILVFNFFKDRSNIERAIAGQQIGTHVKAKL